MLRSSKELHRSVEKEFTSMMQSVRIIGWSTAVLSLCLILSEIFTIVSIPMVQIAVPGKMYPQTISGTEVLAEMFQYDRLWSVYSLVYFLVVFAGSIQFLRFNAAGRMILEVACWAGIVNACIDTLRSYMRWKQMQTILSSVSALTGISAGSLFPFGIASIVLSFLLWIVPTCGMLIYLRKPALRALMK